MRVTEPLLYLPQKGISPLARMVCCMPGCDNKFQVVDGVAFPGTSNKGESVEMFFFCSEVCFLKGIPPASCGRA